MLTTTPRAGLRLTPGLAQAISLLSLTTGELAARLAVEAAANPGLRLVPPGEGAGRPLFDPEGVAAPCGPSPVTASSSTCTPALRVRHTEP